MHQAALTLYANVPTHAIGHLNELIDQSLYLAFYYNMGEIDGVNVQGKYACPSAE
jgi:hypothetical protein